jgi:hypothetical protein
MWCGCTSVIILLCAQFNRASVMRKRRPIAKDSLQFSPSPTAAALSEYRAYCSGVPVFEADIADQRSSKLAAGVLVSTSKPFGVIVPAETAVEGSCVLTLAAVAATASRATATNPVIVRCFVIRTSYGGPPLAWVMGILRRFNGDAIITDCANPKTDNEAVPSSNRRDVAYSSMRFWTNIVCRRFQLMTWFGSMKNRK